MEIYAISTRGTHYEGQKLINLMVSLMTKRFRKEGFRPMSPLERSRIPWLIMTECYDINGQIPARFGDRIWKLLDPQILTPEELRAHGVF